MGGWGRRGEEKEEKEEEKEEEEEEEVEREREREIKLADGTWGGVGNSDSISSTVGFF